MAKNTPPSLRFLVSHPAHFIACGLGSGLSVFAPGTAGTAFAWVTYPLLRNLVPGDADIVVVLALLFVVGILACDVTGRHLGVVDHSAIVWDEIVPFWAVLVLTPPGLAWQTAAFLLFRGYDIVKPPPANYFDEKVKNGLGVMMDDAAAAAYTLFTLAAVRALVGHFTA